MNIRTVALRGLVWLLKLRGSPHAIALGAAIGVFVAFTPTIGFQMVIALFVATALGANRAAAVAPVWITNPATLPPIFAFTYWVGSWMIPGPSIGHVRNVLSEALRYSARLSAWELSEQFMTFFRVTREFMAPLILGGVLVGAATALPSYFVVHYGVRRLRNWREHRQTRRRGWFFARKQKKR